VGHKTHPVGFRLGIIKDWQAHWFAPNGKTYEAMLREDLNIRGAIASRYPDAGIAQVEIERGPHELIINVHTARPGIVIGRGGQRVEELRQALEKLTSKKARLNVLEIRQPELEAYLVARSVADQLERRIAFRRAIRQAVSRGMNAGAQGVKIIISGRLGGAEIARKEKAMEGRVPLHTLRANIDYGFAEANTAMGRIGVKTWIYKGDILPEREEPAEVRLDQIEDEEESPQDNLDMTETSSDDPIVAAQASSAVQDTVTTSAETVEKVEKPVRQRTKQSKAKTEQVQDEEESPQDNLDMTKASNDDQTVAAQASSAVQDTVTTSAETAETVGKPVQPETEEDVTTQKN